MYADRYVKRLPVELPLAAAGIESAEPAKPEAAAAFLRTEIDRFRPVVKAVRPELT